VGVLGGQAVVGDEDPGAGGSPDAGGQLTVAGRRAGHVGAAVEVQHHPVLGHARGRDPLTWGSAGDHRGDRHVVGQGEHGRYAVEVGALPGDRRGRPELALPAHVPHERQPLAELLAWHVRPPRRNLSWATWSWATWSWAT